MQPGPDLFTGLTDKYGQNDKVDEVVGLRWIAKNEELDANKGGIVIRSSPLLADMGAQAARTEAAARQAQQNQADLASQKNRGDL